MNPDEQQGDPSRSWPSGPGLQVGDGPVTMLVADDVVWLTVSGTGFGRTVAGWLALAERDHDRGAGAGLAESRRPGTLTLCPNPRHDALDQRRTVQDGDQVYTWCSRCAGYWGHRGTAPEAYLFVLVDGAGEGVHRVTVDSTSPLWARSILEYSLISGLGTPARADAVEQVVAQSRQQFRRWCG